jgi:hypothetical protein
MNANDSNTSSRAYRSLFKIGSWAAWIVVVLTLVEIMAFSFFPQPATAQEWFILYQEKPFLGLVDFWGLEAPMYLMFVLTFLALYVALRDTQPGLMITATAFVLLGAAIFLSTNNPFTMLTLSHRHAAATTDGERSLFLAAGEAVLANTNQRAVGGFNPGLFLVSSAGIIVSTVMLRADSFAGTTAYVGIFAHILALGDYLRQALTTSPLIALAVIIPGAILLMIWFGLVGKRLRILGSNR